MGQKGLSQNDIAFRFSYARNRGDVRGYARDKRASGSRRQHRISETHGDDKEYNVYSGRYNSARRGYLPLFLQRKQRLHIAVEEYALSIFRNRNIDTDYVRFGNFTEKRLFPSVRALRAFDASFDKQTLGDIHKRRNLPLYVYGGRVFSGFARLSERSLFLPRRKLHDEPSRDLPRRQGQFPS